MPTYKTPGVYVEEISTLPPSVAEVATAVPAFLGYTRKGPEIARVSTLLEYEELFAKSKPTALTVQIEEGDDGTVIREIRPTDPSRPHPEFLMYDCVSHYFKNGGGTCYIVSVGRYSASSTAADFEDGLALLEKEDEPTLIVMPDAVNLPDADYASLCQQALAQCAKLGDRFAILDVPAGDVAGFRDRLGINNLKYGAAYHPYLQTSLAIRYREDEVTIEGASFEQPARWETAFGTEGVRVGYNGAEGDIPRALIVQGASGAAIELEVAAGLLTIRNVADLTGADVSAAWADWTGDSANDPAGFDVQPEGAGGGAVPHTNSANVELERLPTVPVTLASIESTQTAIYHQIKAALAGDRMVLPPSAAIAGVYASVDRDRGVWKAPANVSLSAVIGPTTKITHGEQEGLNVDPTGGKSINAIRAFSGKGTLVWGARTLAGNDNEWRYVSVRRLFNTIEESSRKATSFAVFEPNDTTTWLKVKGMIESYLYGLWEQGALAGPTPDAAYFVHVGLGRTMTPQDVLEGRMIIEIGVAAVRPAEFIILRFTHKLQEA